MDQGFPGGSLTGLQRRVAEGEEPRTVLEELWRALQARLYGYGCKRLGDASQADDFVQKVFLKMQVNFARMIAREPVEAWIFTVARNEIGDWYRCRHRCLHRDLPGYPPRRAPRQPDQAKRQPDGPRVRRLNGAGSRGYWLRVVPHEDSYDGESYDGAYDDAA